MGVRVFGAATKTMRTLQRNTTAVESVIRGNMPGICAREQIPISSVVVVVVVDGNERRRRHKVLDNVATYTEFRLNLLHVNMANVPYMVCTYVIAPT